MNIAKPRSAQHESSAFVHESDHDEYGDDDMEDEDIQRARKPVVVLLAFILFLTERSWGSRVSSYRCFR